MIKYDKGTVINIESSGEKRYINSILNTFRFELIIKTSNSSGKKAVVVMKNPASACLNSINFRGNPNKRKQVQSDQTINNVIKCLQKNYEEIVVLNLFPMMSPNPEDIFKNFNSAGVPTKIETKQLKRNKYVILNYLKTKNDYDFICAWGTYAKRFERLFNKEVFNFLSSANRYSVKLYEYIPNGNVQKLSNLYPIHGKKWV